jgi:hypothetical protein
MPNQHIDYELLLAYAADELESDGRQAIATHIASCIDCANVVRRFRLISFVMRTDDSREPPPATIARAQAIFAQNRPTRASFWQSLANLSFPAFSTQQLARAVVLAVFVLANLVVYGGIGAIVASAQETIPGDALYSVKLNLESIQLAVTWDTGDRVGRHLAFADSRTNETVVLVALQRLAEIPGTLTAFEKEVDLVVVTFELLAKQNFQRAQMLGPGIEGAMARQTTTLANLRDVAVEAIKPALERAIAVSNARRVAVQVLATQPPRPTSTPSATRLLEPTSTRVLAPIAPRTATGFVPRPSAPAPFVTPQPGVGVSPVPITAVVPTAVPPLEKTKTPPGLVRTPTKTPPGLVRTPTPTKAIIIPTATPTVEKSKTPPGQIKTQTPPGQDKTKTPPGLATKASTGDDNKK